MKKALYKFIFILSSVALILVSVVPFSVAAQSVGGSSPIIGVNISVIDFDETYQYSGLSVVLDDNNDRWRCVSFNSSGACNAYGNADTNNSFILNHTILGDLSFSNTTQSISRVYEYEFILDNSYVGSITFNNSFGATSTKVAFVNGSSFKVSSTTLVSSFTVTSYDLMRSDFDTWVYPIESFNVCSYMLNNLPNRYYGLNAQSDYMFPIFRIQSGDKLFSTNVSNNDNWIQTYIFFITASNTSGTNSINSVANFNANFTLSRGECLSYKTINRYQFGGELGYLCQVTIGNYASSGVLDITYTGSLSERYYMPVYCNSQVFNKNVSTDFALIFDMSNRLLDYLETIADSTPESEQAVDSLDDNNDQFASDSQDLMNIEDSYNDDFNDQLNNIDFTNPMTNNPNFLSSASFMINIFNALILNNPLSIFIVIICIVLIAKKVMGK